MDFQTADLGWKFHFKLFERNLHDQIGKFLYIISLIKEMFSLSLGENCG